MKPIFIPLAAGVQTELAEQLVDPGATLVTENCYSPQTGTSRVRLGADVLSAATQATIPAAGTLPLPWQMGTLGGSLVRFGRAPESCHLWAPTAQAWVRHAPDDGGIVSYRRGPLKVTETPVFAGIPAGAQIGTVDIAVGNGYAVEAAEYTTGSTAIRIAFIDLATGQVAREFRTAGAKNPRVIIVGSRAIVAYIDGAGPNIQLDAYSLTTLSLVEQQAMGSCDSASVVDVRAGSVRAGATVRDFSVVYTNTTTGPDIMCAAADASSLASNSTFTVTGPVPFATPQPDIALGWMQDEGASGKFALICCDSTNGLYVLWNLSTEAFGTSLATDAYVLDASVTDHPALSSPGVRNVVGSTTSSFASGLFKVLYEVADPDSPSGAVIKVVAWNGSASTPATVIGAAGIRSKLWKHDTGLYLLTVHDDADQRTYFVHAVGYDLIATASSSSAPLAVSYVRSAGGLTEATNRPSGIGIDDDGNILIAATYETRTESVASSGVAIGGTQRILAAGMITVSHRDAVETELGRPAEFGGALFVPGGALGFFDGHTYGLPGFAYYPPAPTAVGNGAGNLTQPAAYSYRVCYAFVDANGRKWRSTPSTPLEVATDGTDQSFDLTIATLRMIDRGTGNARGYQIEVYRTQENGPGAYFLVASIANDPSVATATLTDNVADEDLGEELYTDGGGLENQLLPSISWCVEFQGRLVCGQAGTGTIWYSLELDLNHGLIFNEALTEDIGDASDPTTGAAVYGEQLYVFKAGKTFLVAGQGGNALGQGGNYDFRRIGDGVGCSNPQTIVVRDGVWFKSSSTRAGFHRTTGGDPEYVGQGVHTYDGLAISSAVVLRDPTEIRWYTEQGTTLVWNWTTRTWGWNTGQACLTATSGYTPVVGAVYCTTAGVVLSEATTGSGDPYTEGGVPYLARVRTPWYRLGGTLSGWGRVRRFQGVGLLPANHRTVVNLYKNQETVPFQTSTIVFGTTRPRWDWEIRPQQQPMSSVMVEVIISPYQAPDIVITPGDDSYDGLDVDTGYGMWTFEHASFTAQNVGAAITIVGGPYAGTYTITQYTSPTQVEMTPIPSAPALPATGLVLDLRGNAGLTSSAGFATAWADQSGFGQDVTDLPGNPGPETGLETIDGIPALTCPLGNIAGRGLYRASPDGILDRNGVHMGYGPGETQTRTFMAMIKPRYSAGAFGITGGLLAEFGSDPTFQPLFDLEDTAPHGPNGFYLWSKGWRDPGTGAIQGPDTVGGSGGIYDGVPTLVEMFSNGFSDIGVRVNGVTVPLTPSAMTGTPAASTTSFALLRAISGGLNFQGAATQFSIWDYDLRTNPTALTQAENHYLARYPSAPIFPGGVGATSISMTPELQYTAGPNMVGVSLLPVTKEGMDKLPSTRRLT